MGNSGSNSAQDLIMGNLKRDELLMSGSVEKRSIENKSGAGKWKRYELKLYKSGILDIIRPVTNIRSRVIIVDGRSRVEKFISSTNDLFLIKQVNYINKDKRPSKGTLFVKTRNESERRKWMNAVGSVIKNKSNDTSADTDATSHRIEISAKDAEAFKKEFEGKEIDYHGFYDKIQKSLKAHGSKRKIGLKELGIGKFMFACAVSRDVIKPSESTIAERMKSRRVAKAQAQKRWQIDTRATMVLKGIKSSRAKRKLMNHANEFSIIAKQAARAAKRQSKYRGVKWKPVVNVKGYPISFRTATLTPSPRIPPKLVSPRPRPRVPPRRRDVVKAQEQDAEERRRRVEARKRAKAEALRKAKQKKMEMDRRDKERKLREKRENEMRVERERNARDRLVREVEQAETPPAPPTPSVDVDERLRKEREQAEREAKEAAEEQRIAKEKAEREREERERKEREREERERKEREILAKEKAEAERLLKEKERLAKLAKKNADKERFERDFLKAKRIAREKIENERLARERAERERIEREKAEEERLERERLEAEKREKDRLEAERLAELKKKAE
eukprot:g1524.t1